MMNKGREREGNLYWFPSHTHLSKGGGSEA